MSASDDEYYTVPLRDQRVFGAGIKRKRVHFVPSSEAATAPPSPRLDGPSIADLYSSIVGSSSSSTKKKPAPETPPADVAAVDSSTEATSAASSSPAAEPASTAAGTEICDVCKLPATSATEGGKTVPHEATLAHQVCLAHSHPPSAIERSRKGLSFLRAYGYDPDARRGLGREGEGILHPIKVKEKRDTVGLGVQVSRAGEKVVVKPRVEKMNAREVRQAEEEGRKRRERLQALFYQSDDVQKYLGELG